MRQRIFILCTQLIFDKECKFEAENTIRALMLIRCKQLNFGGEFQIRNRQYNFGNLS